MEFSTQLKKKKDKLNPCLRILANRNLDFQTNSISLSSGRHWKRRLSYPLVFDHCCIQWPIKRNFLKNSFHQTYLLRKFKFSFHLFSRTLLHIAYCMASKQEIFFFFFFFADNDTWAQWICLSKTPGWNRAQVQLVRGDRGLRHTMWKPDIWHRGAYENSQICRSIWKLVIYMQPFYNGKTFNNHILMFAVKSISPLLAWRVSNVHSFSGG